MGSNGTSQEPAHRFTLANLLLAILALSQLVNLLSASFWPCFITKTPLESIRCALFPSRRGCNSRNSPGQRVVTQTRVPLLCQRATPKICPDLLGEEHSDPGFLFHESPFTSHHSLLFLPARIWAIMSPAIPPRRIKSNAPCMA